MNIIQEVMDGMDTEEERAMAMLFGERSTAQIRGVGGLLVDRPVMIYEGRVFFMNKELS